MSDTTLSLKPGTAESEGNESEAPVHKRILLVEGDGFTRLVLLLRLRLAGFGVDFTSNGILGLGKLRSCQPDILLVELKLCGMSGLELIKAARAEPTFGNRPVYVFTHANRMSRATRKEVGLLATEVFDKASITREDLVQIFATKFGCQEPVGKQTAASAAAESQPPELNEAVVSGAIEELIAGVREQYEVFARDTEPRISSGGELLSRVSSLASCAKAAKLHNLARQANALEKFLNQLARNEQGYADGASGTISRAVDVMSGMRFERNATEESPTQFTAVFLDEAPHSNRALEEALLEAEFEPACFEDAARARDYLAANRTDLFIANVVLPEGHGVAVADIRKFPLHAKTPILFGPDSSLVVPLRDELPVSAPRLDRAPLLVAELVLRALNEVQSTDQSAPSRAVAASPIPSRAQQPIVQKIAAESLPAEDGFQLFAQATRQEVANASGPSPKQGVVASAAVNQPQAFNHLFAAAGIPSEPILRSEPSTPEADNVAKIISRLAVTQVDKTQIDERPIEALTPSTLQPEDTQSPQAEPTVEDQTAAEPWRVAVPADDGQTIVWSSIKSECEQNQAAPVEEAGVLTPDNGEVMNNELQTAPAVFAPGDASQSGEDSNGHQSPREDLAARVCAAEMSLYHAHIEIEQKEQAIAALQSQLAEAKAGQSLAPNAPAQDSAAESKAQARCAELEQEIAALRQVFEGFNGSFGEQQQASAEAGKHVQDLEQRLNQTTAELEQKREQQQKDHAELQRQLQAANAACQQAEARGADLEQKLTSVRKAHEELLNKPPQGQKVAANPSESGSTEGDGMAGVPASDLEQQVRQGVAALAQATAELAQERGERQRSQQLAADLNGRLQALHVELSRTLQVQGENLARISALEQQHHQTKDALDRSTADLEQHQAERESLETQLQKAKDANAQLRKDLSFFDEANKKFDGSRQELQTRLEANLGAARDHEARLHQEKEERQKLAQSLEEAQRELRSQSRRHESLEQQLQAAQDALQDREAKLQKESAERKRLSEALDSVQHGVPGGPERELEFSKLQSALQLEQVERKRQELQLARTRQNALDAARATRALRTSLRRQIREPLDNLIHSTSSLLELEMGDEQKKLAQAVLQDVLLVQTRLRETAASPADSAEPSTPASTPAS
jgi:DNA-binding response OmpR family regulator